MAGDSQVILTGDFNVDQKNESYTLLNTSGILKDSYEMSPIRYELNGTFNNFKINLKTDERIDHIFLTNGFKVLRHGILTECYWTPGEDKNAVDKNGNFPQELSLYKYISRLPSDHYPVVTIVEY
jgi:endonuclease/exonuclease/phosphatase family metal-dependent hydrolase